MGTFEGLHVVVTGGTGALGSSVVGQLLEAGTTCHVPCVSEAERAAFTYAKHARVRLVMGIDLSDERQVVAFYHGLPASLWASVHIAGGFSDGAIADVSAAEFQRQWSMNVLTCWLCCREAVKVLRAGKGGGRIVNVASRPGVSPDQANMTAYTAAKAGVVGLTVSLAAELASERIWVNAVAPSIMDTPANRTAMPNANFASWPKVDEVARTICWLASPENRITRGGIVPVYGQV